MYAIRSYYAIILLALVLSFSGAFAQKGKVTSAQNFKDTGKLDKAVEAITEATDASNPKAEKSVPWPKTWEVKGDVITSYSIHYTKLYDFFVTNVSGRSSNKARNSKFLHVFTHVNPDQ